MSYWLQLKVEKNARPESRKPLALVVHHDLDFVVAAATNKNLEREFDVLIATTALEAIDQIVTLKRLDILLLDCDLPGIESRLVASTFRQFFTRSSLVLMRTAGNSVEFFEEGVARA